MISDLTTITSELFSSASFVEIPDFMTPEEADHIIELAEESGFAKSDIHLDPKAKEHAQTLRSMEGNALLKYYILLPSKIFQFARKRLPAFSLILARALIASHAPSPPAHASSSFPALLFSRF